MLYLATQNGPIYEKMEALLKELEVTRTAEEIKNRIKGLPLRKNSPGLARPS